MLHIAVTILLWLFPVSEVALALRARARAFGARSEDRGSFALLWTVFGLAITAATWLSFTGWTPLPLAPALREGLVLGLMGSGLVLRWASILTLGRFFTVDVAIHGDHAVVRRGPYAWVRHPSYSGLLLLFLGLALHLGSVISFFVMMVPVCVAGWRRIQVEEAALLQALGEPYAAYCRETRRLVPGLL